MPDLFDKALTASRKKDKQMLRETEVPIVTVSGTYREDVKEMHGFVENETLRDIVFSRAHYSMALGIAVAVWGKTVDHKKAWIVDPTNYVSEKQWRSIQLTEFIGKTLARNKILKILKDFVDKFGRGKLPILSSITPPLLYLTEGMKKPILSLHIASGNILAGQGKTILQVITDPHVRYDYLEHAEKKNMHYCVFDERTQFELLEKAKLSDKDLDPNRITVTGPPIDPRIVAARKQKKAWRSGPIKLLLTTGGLGTNTQEINQVLESLLPHIQTKDPDLSVKLMIYAGTHKDIKDSVTKHARKYKLTINNISNRDPDTFIGTPPKTTKLPKADIHVLYHPQILDANELLIRYGFPWADGVITKPSGDMAYDAVAAGCFLLTLSEWGEWEHNIRAIFEQKSIARQADPEDLFTQLLFITDTHGKSQSWAELAMHNALTIDPLFLKGAENIVSAYRKLAK